jgi:hypothetical protein
VEVGEEVSVEVVASGLAPGEHLATELHFPDGMDIPVERIERTNYAWTYSFRVPDGISGMSIVVVCMFGESILGEVLVDIWVEDHRVDPGDFLEVYAHGQDGPPLPGDEVTLSLEYSGEIPQGIVNIDLDDGGSGGVFGIIERVTSGKWQVSYWAPHSERVTISVVMSVNGRELISTSMVMPIRIEDAVNPLMEEYRNDKGETSTEDGHGIPNDQTPSEDQGADIVEDEARDDGPLIYTILIVAVTGSIGFFVSMALYSTIKIDAKKLE